MLQITKILALQLTLLAPLVGCNPSAGPAASAAVGNVSGTVTLEGKPLSQGTLLFEKTDHSVALVAAIGPDGAFIAKPYQGTGLPVGRYRLAVSSTPPGKFGETSPSRNPNDKVPQRYRTLNTSGLAIDVSKGDNPPVKIELIP